MVSSMTEAIGVLETQGIPAALMAADIMDKAAAVQVMALENTHAGRISVVIRGPVGAVQTALAAAVEALKHQPGTQILGHHVRTGSTVNLEDLLWSGQRPNSRQDDLDWLDD